MLAAGFRFFAVAVGAMLLVVALSVGGVLLRLQFGALSLAWGEESAADFLTWRLGAQVEIGGLRLEWADGAPVLSVSQFEASEGDTRRIRLDDISLTPSGRALLEAGRLLPREVSVGKATFSAKETSALFAPLAAPVNTGGDLSALAYISRIAIADISIDTGPFPASEKSHLLLTRTPQGTQIDMRLHYQVAETTSRVEVAGKLNARLAGKIDIVLTELRLDDLAGAHAMLAPLSGFALPADATLVLDVEAGGRVARGTMSAQARAGEVAFVGRRVAVADLAFHLVADFAENTIALTRASLAADGFRSDFSGRLAYALRRGAVETIDVALAAENAHIDLPEFFDQPFTGVAMQISGIYDVASAVFSMTEGQIVPAATPVALSGEVFFAEAEPRWRLQADFGAMPVAEGMRMWPRNAAPRTRGWVAANLSGGTATGGQLRFAASRDILPLWKEWDDDVFGLDLNVVGATLRIHPNLPPIANAAAAMKLGGRNLEITLSRGQITAAPDTPPIALRKGVFGITDYRNPQTIAGVPHPVNFADIGVDFSGSANAQARLVEALRLEELRDLEVSSEALSGELAGRFTMTLPLARGLLNSADFEVQARSENLALEGAPFVDTLSDGRVSLAINRARLHVEGRARANGVDFALDWRQPFGARRDDSKLEVRGELTADDFVLLDVPWVAARMEGVAGVSVILDGRLTHPTRTRLTADLTDARFAPVPLAYDKPADVRATLEATITGDDKLRAVRFDYRDENEPPFTGEMVLKEGVITAMTLGPFGLGRSRDVRMALSDTDEGRRLSIVGEAFDMTALFDSPLNPVETEFETGALLGGDFALDVELDSLHGSGDTTLSAVRSVAMRRDSLTESLRFEGVFEDGTELLAGIARTPEGIRQLDIQAENAGKVLRWLDVLSDIEGGVLRLRATMDSAGGEDDTRMKGNFDMVSFRARRVPLLARLLSLGSLTGIADTLNGNGIAFDAMTGEFDVAEGRLNLSEGHMAGNAVGLTARGHYVIASGDSEFRGTLIPAYRINTLLERVPLVGRLFTGKSAEGVFGIDYRITRQGEDDPSVAINPLRLITPGILKDVFDFERAPR